MPIDANHTDFPACASQIAPTADAAQAGPKRDIDDLPVHGALEDRAEQTARHIDRDIRTYGSRWNEGVSW